MDTCSLDFASLISDRATALDVSGIRRAFELGAKLKNPINLSIGQPDFPVPEAIKQRAIEAVQNDRNGYTLTQGAADLRAAITRHLAADIGWHVPSDDLDMLVTSGTSGGLMIAFLALLNPGDEAIIADPYFVIYPALAGIAGAKAVFCDTYPDFRMTAERIEPLLTERTKLVLLNSPSNPTGVVLSSGELQSIVDLCERRGVVLISDEIYDQFTYADSLENGRFPTPGRMTEQMLLVRGFGKTYGCTGWRLGYAAGPKPLIQQMMKLQQYTFVCAPSIAQAGAAAAFEVDMSSQVRTYAKRRDRVVEVLGGLANVAHPGGAFYAFVEVPAKLGLTASQFAQRAVEHNVVIIPGSVFSQRDTHFRLSYAVPDGTLEQGLSILADLLQ